MICSICGGLVLWMGPIVCLSHTECQSCGSINCQIPEEDFEPEGEQ